MDGQRGSVTAVFDSYQVPTARCVITPNATGPTAPVGRPYASEGADIGVGLIDGPVNLSHFVAYQLGVKAICPDFFQNASYFAEYFSINAVPDDPLGFDGSWVAIPNFVVQPGDSIRSVESWSFGNLTFGMRDVTSRAVFLKTLPLPSFVPNGAACLIDQFNNVAKITSTTHDCRATVRGTTGGIGTFSARSIVYRTLEMGLDGTTVAMVPSPLASDGATYTDRWITSTPWEIEHTGLLYQRQAPGFAGYVLLNNRSGSVTAVSDSYVQPTATCNVSEKLGGPTAGFFPGDQNFLVGSGLYAGDLNLSHYRSYEVGTEAYCPEFNTNPVYIPYYLEAAAGPSFRNVGFTMVRLPGVTVHPGDLVRSSVVVSSLNHVRFMLTDVSDHVTVSATIVVPGIAPNGAACVSQPLGNLAVFSTTSQTCRATVDGQTRGIGDFAFPNLLDRFDLVNNGGTAQATTSALTNDGATFSVRWITSLPVYYEP